MFSSEGGQGGGGGGGGESKAMFLNEIILIFNHLRTICPAGYQGNYEYTNIQSNLSVNEIIIETFVLENMEYHPNTSNRW